MPTLRQNDMKLLVYTEFKEMMEYKWWAWPFKLPGVLAALLVAPFQIVFEVLCWLERKGRK